MANIDEIVKKYFNSKTSGNPLEQIMQLIREVDFEMTVNETLKEEKESVKYSKEAKKFVLSLPKFTPSESWGDPNSQARKEMVNILKAVGGGANLEQKLQFLERLQVLDTKITSPRRIISTLILLESLSACVNSFGSSAAGYIFEGFLAALLGGQQVSDADQGNLPIEDIIAFSTYGGSQSAPMSLKLLKKGGTIKGSYTNLVDALNKYPAMVYVVAYKLGDKDVEAIEINSFDISRENLLLILSQSGRNMKLAQLEDMSPQESLGFLSTMESWDELYTQLQRTAGYQGKPATPEPQVAMDMEAEDEEQPPEELTEANGAGTQWYISLAQLNKMGAEVGWGVDAGANKPVATLNVSPTALYETAERYMKYLDESIVSLFSAVQKLSENINGYFSSAERGPAITQGNNAIKNAQTIEAEMVSQTQDTQEK